MNQKAWESSYLERNLPIPDGGPREGYWGARLGSKIPHPILGWHEPKVSVPVLLDIDENGFQRYKPVDYKYSIAIFGGSVAFGAYTSSIKKTYFYILGEMLERCSTPAEITVVASGAWKSSQEIRALNIYGPLLKPDLIIFLDGLNDLTVGATARALYGEQVQTEDGSEWSVLYHSHDYEQRARDYLSNMSSALKISENLGSHVLIALQPSLAEKSKPTDIEQKLLHASLKPHKSAASIIINAGT